MITAIVKFPLPQGTTLEAAKQMFENSVPNYEGAQGLIRKYYLYDEEPTAGGVYLWESLEAADRQCSDEWKDMIHRKFGTPPNITYFETPVVVGESAVATAHHRDRRAGEGSQIGPVHDQAAKDGCLRRDRGPKRAKK